MLRLPRLFRRRRKELDCEDTRSLASDYVDGELNEGTAEKVHRHLAWCSPCQAFIATFSKTVGLLRSISQESAPPQAKERIIAKAKDISEGKET